MTVHLRGAWTSIVPRSNKGADPYQDLNSLRKPVRLDVYYLPEDIDYQFQQPEPLLVALLKNDLNYGGLSDLAYNFAVAGNKEGMYLVRGCRSKDAFQLKDKEETLSVLALLGKGERPTDQLLENLRLAFQFAQHVYPIVRFRVPDHHFYLSTIIPDLKLNEDTVPFPRVDGAMYLESESVHVHGLIEALSYYGYYKTRNDARYGPVTRQAVAELQYDMKEAGFYHKAVDGYYGRWTRDGFERYKTRL